jgi:hypothetical protein
MTSATRLVHDLSERARFALTRPVTRVTLDDGQTALTEQALEQMLRRVVHLAQIGDRCGRAQADGFPSTTPGNGSPGSGKGGGRTMPIPTPTGELDHVPTSSTEAAALAGRIQADPLSTITTRAISHLRRAVHELEELDAALGEADRLRLLSKVPDPPQCYVTRELFGLPFDDEWAVFRVTSFPKLNDPRFDEPRRVCSWVYYFVRNHSRLPTRDEAIKHLRRVPIDRAAGKAK